MLVKLIVTMDTDTNTIILIVTSLLGLYIFIGISFYLINTVPNYQDVPYLSDFEGHFHENFKNADAETPLIATTQPLNGKISSLMNPNEYSTKFEQSGNTVPLNNVTNSVTKSVFLNDISTNQICINDSVMKSALTAARNQLNLDNRRSG